jgi:phage terminase large subunit-like protein
VVAQLADELGVPLLDWQKYVLNDALQIMPNGRWARSQVGVLCARQNGKTHLMRMRILGGLYIFGEKNAIAMSQTRQLSLDTFKQTVDMAESLDWMRKRIKRVSRTNGQEELEIYCHHYPKSCNGKCERIRKYSIRAATSEGPRGATADLLYVDELREIDEATWAAVTPITRARPNAQIFWTSNAGDLTSTVLNEQRRRALTFASDRMGYYEYSAPAGSSVDDIEAWKHANPAMGHTISDQNIRDAATFDSPDAFKTESLSMWVDAIDSPWPMQVWNECESEVALEDGLPTWMAMDLNFNRELACLVTLQQREKGYAVFLHEWKKEGGINDLELAGEIATLTRRYRPRVLAYDPNTAGYIAPRLAQAGVPVAPTPWNSANFAIMCDQTMNAMQSRQLIHPAQETMHSHLVSCARRPASDGGWRIARRAAQVPISAAVALVMAVGHATEPQQSVSIVSA